MRPSPATRSGSSSEPITGPLRQRWESAASPSRLPEGDNPTGLAVGRLVLIVHGTDDFDGVNVAPNARDPGGYLAGKAPNHVTPGVQTLEGRHVDDLGRVQPWRAHYDGYGRQIARTDFDAGNQAQGIPDVHHHAYEYTARYPLGREVLSHVPGEYQP